MIRAQFNAYDIFPPREPCPCGSQKRFKNCCKGSVGIDTAKLKAAERDSPGTLSRLIGAFDANHSN